MRLKSQEIEELIFKIQLLKTSNKTYSKVFCTFNIPREFILSQEIESLPDMGVVSFQDHISAAIENAMLIIGTQLAQNSVDEKEISVGKLRGQGSFKRIFEAVWKSRNVALVRFSGAESLTLKEEELLRKEFKLQRQLGNHPNILSILGITSSFSLVVELADSDLKDAVTDAKPSLEDRMKWASEIIKGLLFMHCMGAYHGQLKPENIMICKGTAKLSDFGSAKLIFSTAMGSNLVGIEGFQGPEISDRKSLSKIDPRDKDLYGLGGILLFLFSGVNPWASIIDMGVQGGMRDFFKSYWETQKDVFPDDEFQVAGKYFKDMELDASLSDQILGLIKQCMKTDPKGRIRIADLYTKFTKLRDTYLKSKNIAEADPIDALVKELSPQILAILMQQLRKQ